MYQSGKTTFRKKQDYEAFLLQSSLDTLAYLKHTCPDQIDVIEAVESDLNKILALNKSPLKKLG